MKRKWTILLSFDSIVLDFSLACKPLYTRALIGSFSVPILVNCVVQMPSLNDFDFFLFERFYETYSYIQSLKSIFS